VKVWQEILMGDFLLEVQCHVYILSERILSRS
jgi:hypothetical protein